MKRKFKAVIIAAALLFCSASSQAISLFSHTFIFKGDVKEWSEPIETTLTTDKMEKKGQEPIPIRVRVRVTRKIFRGCEYEVEVTNMDKARTLYYDMDGRQQKPKGHKLSAGETDTYKTDTFLTKNCPEEADCGNGGCPYDIRFKDVKVKG